MNHRVLFYVQHLLGIGHLRRAATLARAIAAAGMRTTLVSGGNPLPDLDVGGVEFLQLPPTRATDLHFRELVDETGAPISEAWKANRRELLLQAWRERRPQVVIIELFPFGRRQMRFELVPLLEAARAAPNPPMIVCSVRDILVGPGKHEREREMLSIIDRNFDAVLVHGDPNLIPFERTFPLASRLGGKLHYTGYVVDSGVPQGKAGGPGDGEVIVSAGGGAVGEALLRTAIAARRLSSLRQAHWRVLVGVSVPAESFAALQRAAPPGVRVERARTDFPQLLSRCRMSVSQGGYNTMMEVIHARCRAVVVPYAGGNETEQTLRASLLAERGLLEMVAEQELAPDRLASAIDRAARLQPAAAFAIDASGAATTARLVQAWCDERAG